MSDKKFVNAALDRYFTTLTSQISAGDELKSAVNDLLARKESPDAQKPGNLDEWDDLDQSYISIKLQNAFSEIENRAVTLENNVMKLRTREKETFWLETSAEEVITLVFALVKELHQYHKAVADCLAPLVEYSVYRERYPTKYEMKECSSVPVTWKAVNEVNRSLRYGYGLSKEDLASILSWKHGEDLSESTRKALNQRVDSLIQTYKERLSNLDTCEVDVPIAFQLYPLVLQDILKDCCSPVESIAAVGQIMPDKKEDLDTLILREIPRIQLKIGDDVHEVASPGKAFENTKQKMHAVRHLVTKAFKSQRHQVSKEQLDLFSLKVLATACISVANASSRTAVLMAFGKANLIQVKPSLVKLDDQLAQINLDNRSIIIEVPSQWCLVEDSVLLGSLPRDINCTMPIAIVDTVYRGSFDIKAEIEKRAQSLPLVRIQRCSGMMKNQDKKDQPSKGIRKRLSRATHKLFNRRSTSGIPQKTSPKMSSARDHVVTSAGIVNLAANILDNDKDIGDMDVASKSGAESNDPVPPPRPRRKARKKRKSENARKQQREIEEAKHDPKWFSSCRKLQAPEPVQNKMASNSLSVASFEELQEVIDFLSGSSTSSLCLSQQLDADKGGLKRSVATKQAQSTLGIDDKGKISPSDSGIGSTMSMRSHPSVASISTFSSLNNATNNHAGMLKTGISDENSRIILNKDGKLQIESSCEDDNDNDDDEDDEGCTIALENKLAFEAHEDDSRFEDAEVEHYIRKSSSCLQLVGERGRKLKGASEDPCKTPTVTPTSSMSSENDKETSVQDVIDDLKAMGFQNSDLDATSCQNEAEGDVDQQKGLHKACCKRATSEAEPDVESAVASDHHSYDADGSEESEESNPQPDEKPKTFPSNSLRGSTESLYYSAWELNEFATDNEANSKEQAATKIDHQTDSFFSDGLKEPGLKESGFKEPGLKETGITESGLSEILQYPESLQECEQQPPDMLYQHFNPRFSWPADLGGRFAGIWSGGDNREVDSSVPTPGIWQPSAAARRNNLHDVSKYRQMPFQHASHANQPLDWTQGNEDQWKSVATASMQRQHHENVFASEWPLQGTEHATLERNAPLHPSFKCIGVSTSPRVSQPGNWSPQHPSLAGRSRGTLGGPLSQSFARPASVPSQISRSFAAPSTSSLPCNQAGFDLDVAGAAKHVQTPPFHISSGHSAKYQNWSRETGSEPILSGSNTRQISEIEAMALHQNQARQQIVNRMYQNRHSRQNWP